MCCDDFLNRAKNQIPFLKRINLTNKTFVHIVMKKPSFIIYYYNNIIHYIIKYCKFHTLCRDDDRTTRG